MNDKARKFTQLMLSLREAVLQQHSLETSIIELTGGGCPYIFARENGLHAEPANRKHARCVPEGMTEEQFRSCLCCTEPGTSTLSFCWFNTRFSAEDTHGLDAPAE